MNRSPIPLAPRSPSFFLVSAALAAALVFAALPARASESCSIEETAGNCGAPSGAEATPAASPAPVAPVAPVAAPAGKLKPIKLKPVKLQMFYMHDCPHCHEAMRWLPELEKEFPNLTVEKYEVKKNPENRKLWEQTAAAHGEAVRGVPTFYIGGESIVGFSFSSDETGTNVLLRDRVLKLSSLDADGECGDTGVIINIPFFGPVHVDKVSLPQLTLTLGLLDSLNPCAIWVLTFLLSILVHSKNREKIAMIGGVFVAASGLVYFAFMAAWLNLFMVIGMHKAITIGLALVAIVMGLINIKELFFFKKGISLMIPESAKPKIAGRVRGILNQQNTLLAFLSTAVLAVFANFVELGCTVGFPAVFTKILAQRVPDSALTRYGYMALYNVIYVVPLALIVTAFVATMGHFRLTERQAKPLKLISGTVMLALGLVMLFKPELLVLG